MEYVSFWFELDNSGLNDLFLQKKKNIYHVDYVFYPHTYPHAKTAH
jgi:hypothetical protein